MKRSHLIRSLFPPTSCKVMKNILNNGTLYSGMYIVPGFTWTYQLIIKIIFFFLLLNLYLLFSFSHCWLNCMVVYFFRHFSLFISNLVGKQTEFKTKLPPYLPTPDWPEWAAFAFFYLKSNVFWSIIQQSFTFRICLFNTFSFKMHMPTKKYKEKRLTNYV